MKKNCQTIKVAVTDGINPKKLYRGERALEKFDETPLCDDPLFSMLAKNDSAENPRQVLDKCL
jgi:hypothetical protein